MTAAPLRLGDLELRRRIGRGGTAEVWLADHLVDGTPERRLAVKLFTEAAKTDAGRWASFERELDAIAALDHPHIVRIHDHGRVRAEEARGQLVAGTPYIVMDYAPGGTLSELLGTLDWPTQRILLLGLLDALAHAHARGLLHQDVKPSNVLVVDGEAVLADFGVALRLERGPEAGREDVVLGTPGFMAPEQIRARHREFGPATDLYAVGIVAYALATGTLPFPRGHDALTTMRWQLRGSIRPFQPTMPVPDGLGDFILRLLDQGNEPRPAFAAHAALALRALDAQVAAEALAPLPPRPVSTGTTVVTRSLGLDLDAPAEPPRRVASPIEPPVPLDWRATSEHASATHLVDAGLRLYGLRPLPFVGREAERDALWSALRGVAAARLPAAVVLRGPAGAGRSRLAQWLCHRAHELGIADHLVARFSALPEPGAGLGAALEAHLRCRGLAEPEALERVELLLQHRDPDEAAGDARALVALARGAERGGGRGSAEAQRALLLRLLADASTPRPFLVVLDDAQHDADSIELVERALKTGTGGRVLFVLTVQDEALAERAAAGALLLRLLRRERAQAIDVAALVGGGRRAFIDGLLGFAPELAARVEERTAGNPLFAVELVRDWVQRGVLVQGSRGLKLARGAEVELPSDLGHAWSARVARLLVTRPAEDAAALELAAALGGNVDLGEWGDVCRRAGFGPPLALVEALRRRGLVHVEPDGSAFRFAHELLRESILDGAREHGRLVAWHGLCADALLARPGTDRRRVAMQLRAAGRHREALEPLLRAITLTRERDDNRLAVALLEEAEDTLERSGLSRTDDQAFEVRNQRLMFALQHAELDEARATLATIEKAAEEAGTPRARSHLLRAQANLLVRTGRLREAAATLREAVEHNEAIGGGRHLRQALGMLSFALMRLGGWEEAATATERRIELARAAGDTLDEAMALGAVVSPYVHLGLRDEAVRIAGVALERARELDLVGTAAQVHNELGELHRSLGEMPAAERHYRESVRLFRRLGYAGVIAAEWNLALIHLRQERFGEARATLSAIEAQVDERGARNLQGLVHLHQAVCAAGLAHGSEVDLRLPLAARLLDETGFVDQDAPSFGMQLARLCEQQGWTERTEAAVALARAAARRLDPAADTDGVDALLLAGL